MDNFILIQGATLVNEGAVFQADVLIHNAHIARIGTIEPQPNYLCIDGTGKHLLPGVIDGQVHFRDPGLTHKGDLYTESKAAVAGGVTSFIDMPNTVPNVLTPELLLQKYALAAEKSLANYSFFLGVNSENIDVVNQAELPSLLGVSDDGLYFTKKGNLLADNPEIMEKLFSTCKSIIAIH